MQILRRFLTSAAFACGFFGVTGIQAELIPLDKFPDPNFQAWLKARSLVNADNMVNTSATNAKTIRLDVSVGNTITDLTGIEYFTEMTSITIPDSPAFPVLNVSGMQHLTKISTSNTQNTNTTTTPSATNFYNKFKNSKLVAVYANDCPELKEMTLSFLSSLETAEFRNCPKLKTVGFRYTGVRELDFSNNILGAESGGGTLMLDNCTGLRSLKFGYQPYLSILHVKGTKLRALDLSQFTGEHNQTSQSFNLNDNRLTKEGLRLPAGENSNKITTLTLSGNQLTTFHGTNGTTADNLNYPRCNPSFTSQTVYVGKNVSRVKIADERFSSSYHQYYIAPSGNGKIVKEGKNVYFEFNSTDNKDGKYYAVVPISTASSNSVPSKDNQSSSSFGKAQPGKQYLTVILKRDYDDSIEPATLRINSIADDNEESYQLVSDKGVATPMLNHIGNGTYEYTYDGRLMGEFNIQEINPAATAALADGAEDDGVEVLHTFGGVDAQDTNAFDNYVFAEAGKTYLMDENSAKPFSTHFDATGGYRDANPDKTIAYLTIHNTPTVRVTYLPEEGIKTVTIISPAKNEITGIDNVVAETIDTEAEYFNLQGVRVDGNALVPGIYIERRGASCRKVLVK